MKQQILPKIMKHKLQKGDIDQLQDQRKKKKVNPPDLETQNKFKMVIEMDSMPTIKKLGQLKQKA